MKVILLVLCLFVSVHPANGQDLTNRRYPNELKRFKLWTMYGLTSLNPGLSGKSEIDAVLGAVMDKCEAPWHASVGACKLDENWDVSYTQTENLLGNLDSIIFYPRKRIPFSRVRFPNTFEKGRMGIVHSIDAEEFLCYADKYGLQYVVVNEPGDAKYKKGDLFYVEYGLTAARARIVQSVH